MGRWSDRGSSFSSRKVSTFFTSKDWWCCSTSVGLHWSGCYIAQMFQTRSPFAVIKHRNTELWSPNWNSILANLVLLLETRLDWPHSAKKSLIFPQRYVVQAYDLFGMKCIVFKEISFLPVIYIPVLWIRPHHFISWMWLSDSTHLNWITRGTRTFFKSFKVSMVCLAWIKKSLISTCMLVVLLLYSAHHSETYIQHWSK